MKKDIFNHVRGWEAWKKNLTPKYIEEGLSKENSKLFIQYLLDLEDGANIPKDARKGKRDPKTLNRLRNKVSRILKLLEEFGIKDISKCNEREITKFFSKWEGEGHSPDYAKRFKAFWHWWMTLNRRKGKLILDVTEDLSTSNGKKPPFVWISKKQLDNYKSYFSEKEQLILTFCFDSIIRSPTELLSLRVENIYQEDGEVVVDVPDDISKTFGRKFNLVYCGSEVLKYIRENKLNPEDYLFNFSSQFFNRKMQEVASKVFGSEKSKGGEYFNKITLYDLRHSGAIHIRKLLKETGQSPEILKTKGGWTNWNMVEYYTRMLGLDGKIDRNKTLLSEDKTKLELQVQKMEKQLKDLSVIKEFIDAERKVIKDEIPLILEEFDKMPDSKKKLAMQGQLLFDIRKSERKVVAR